MSGEIRKLALLGGSFDPIHNGHLALARTFGQAGGADRVLLMPAKQPPHKPGVRLADESACVTEVVQGKADGFLYDQLTIYRNHQANPDTTEAVFIPFQDAEEWGIAVKKGNTELLDQLNAFIAQSKTDGEFDRLTEKYLADEKKAFDQYGFKWFFDFE